MIRVRVGEHHPADPLAHRRADDRVDVALVVGARVDHRDLVDPDEIGVRAGARERAGVGRHDPANQWRQRTRHTRGEIGHLSALSGGRTSVIPTLAPSYCRWPSGGFGVRRSTLPWPWRSTRAERFRPWNASLHASAACRNPCWPIARGRPSTRHASSSSGRSDRDPRHRRRRRRARGWRVAGRPVAPGRERDRRRSCTPTSAARRSAPTRSRRRGRRRGRDTRISSTGWTRASAGSRHDHAGTLLARACGAEAGIVVNNNAAAVLLVARRAGPRPRGDRVARRAGGDRRRLPRPRDHGRVAAPARRGRHHQPHAPRRLRARPRPTTPRSLLKVHASNYRMVGFVESTPVAELAALGPPVMVDAGSGLLDETTPWLARAAAVAARRTGRPPVPRRRRRARDVLGRQAARRAAGRHHRRPRRAGGDDRTATRSRARCAPTR